MNAKLPRTLLIAALASALFGCATPSAPVSKTTYDFGGLPTAPHAIAAAAPQAPLALAEIQTAWGQNSTAMEYRLNYADAQALMPYALARWSMPPAQLVAQRVRAVLSEQRPVVSLGDSSTPFVLQLALEDFGQRFDSPQNSEGAVHLRATLLNGDRLLAQRDFKARATAPTADAAGGAKALREATNAAAAELANWLNERMR